MCNSRSPKTPERPLAAALITVNFDRGFVKNEFRSLFRRPLFIGRVDDRYRAKIPRPEAKKSAKIRTPLSRTTRRPLTRTT